MASFVALPDAVTDLADAIDSLRELVSDHRITFCDGVVRELQDLSPDDLHPRVRSLATERREPREADFTYVEVVQEHVPDVDGGAAQRDIAAPWVIAHALELLDQEVSVKVVTEDFRETPGGRVPVAEACAVLGVETCRLRQCMTACGLGHLLR